MGEGIVIDEKLMDYCNKHDLRLEEYCTLLALRIGVGLLAAYLRGKSNDQIKVILQPMVRKNLLDLKAEDFKLENYELTEYGRRICGETPINLEELTGRPVSTATEEKTGMDLFIDSYLELFPKGVKNGGNKPLRSNATDVKAKMLKFMNKYKHTKDIILKATKNYIERLRGVYTYCPTSEYFIMKDGSSALATECEMVKNGSNSDEIINPFQKRM